MASKPARRPKKNPGRTAKAGVRKSPVRASATRGTRQKPAQKPAHRPARSLTRREVEELRRLLEAERVRLNEELKAIEERLPEVEQVGLDASGSYDEDLVDVASDTFEREKGLAIENSVHQLLHQIEEALVRVEGGSYGICQVCEQPIHPDRLRALPYAMLCIRCKEREERTAPR
ncbi:MAG: hypothetical protein FJX73_01725 [Armatimonadetes bacterium]|nr:hypothetical protein [Armatimonadota bacterium]